MKIVILVHNLTGGGAERAAALWATGFAERGHSVSIITQDTNRTSRYELSSKVNVFNIRIPLKNRLFASLLWRLGIMNMLYVRNLKKNLFRIRPDVCIGVMGTYARDAFFITRNLQTLVVQTYHSAFELPDNAPLVRKREIKTCYIRDKDIPIRTVLTQADKDYIGSRMRNVFVLPNPLAFRPLDAVPIKKKYVLACGRLDVWDVKGFDVLINAWGTIAKDHSLWKLRIAGSGSVKSLDFLKKLVAKKQLFDQVEFLGFRDDVVELYKESEVFVLSSRYEGFGMVLIEAMSQGCACVACDYKGRQREIIENETQGLICDVDNPLSLARALKKMIDDDYYRRTCQENSIRRSKYFSVSKTIDRWDSIFLQMGVNKNELLPSLNSSINDMK